ncbi:outer membrane beta-barrel protein [uncultured Hoeflea sp.]|uniref:outer membrane beta-barrel protein n=1 Tax=uncultured Hoeflea sp. TaxID=538666 RepID=UPI002617DB5C|nr:outer membrane beta-barrel protein [uncultured Hoeflea sp.]
MRNRIITRQNRRAARHGGLCFGVSALCLLGAVAAAQAQSAAESGSATATYPLRGTTTSGTGSGPYTAATLYGALPSATSGASDASSETSDTEPDGVEEPADEASGALTTEPVSAAEAAILADEAYAESLARQNGRVESLDGVSLEPEPDRDGVPGFMIGTLNLRPTLAQRIVRETVRNGDTKTNRTYSETTVSGTLTSDWSRHQFSASGSGTWQENLSGTGTESPFANLDAALRLDLINDITSTLSGGYTYSQESRTDPNAIEGASTQSGIHEVRGSLGVQKTFGALRGTSTVEVTRTMYGDATLEGGGSVAVNDRDTLGVELTTRIGYVVSPALVPFIEGSIGRENYDQEIDSTGAERSSDTYALRAGAEVDLGEKLAGEFAVGFLRRSLDDPNLDDITGLTLDGDLEWSPLRGTTVGLGVATTVEAATSAGEAGAVVYEFDASLNHQLHSAVVARLGATLDYRDYDSGSGRSNQREYGASAGLTWSINRYLDLEADASYEKTVEPGRTDEETTRIGLGLRLRR